MGCCLGKDDEVTSDTNPNTEPLLARNDPAGFSGITMGRSEGSSVTVSEEPADLSPGNRRNVRISSEAPDVAGTFSDQADASSHTAVPDVRDTSTWERATAALGSDYASQLMADGDLLSETTVSGIRRHPSESLQSRHLYSVIDRSFSPRNPPPPETSCISCHSPLPSSALYCMSCGRPQSSPAAVTPIPFPTLPKTPPSEPIHHPGYQPTPPPPRIEVRTVTPTDAVVGAHGDGDLFYEVPYEPPYPPPLPSPANPPPDVLSPTTKRIVEEYLFRGREKATYASAQRLFREACKTADLLRLELAKQSMREWVDGALHTVSDINEAIDRFAGEEEDDAMARMAGILDALRKDRDRLVQQLGHEGDPTGTLAAAISQRELSIAMMQRRMAELGVRNS